MTGSRVWRGWLSGVVLGAAACSGARLESDEGRPTLSLPARLAEGRGDGETEGDPEPDADAAASTTDGGAEAISPLLRYGSLPDPEPLRLAAQWEYELVYAGGDVRVARVERRALRAPRVTPRVVGRFAIELWIGQELVDRVRFDFPLLAAEEVQDGKRRPLHDPPSLVARSELTRRVLVPASPRATRAILVDRATGQVTPLPWPPDAPLGPSDASSAADAGLTDASTPG